MRVRHPLALALGATVLIVIAPDAARACHWWGHHHRPAYAPAYYGPGPMYATQPMYAAPPMYYAPGQGAPFMLPRSVGPAPMPAAPSTPTTDAAIRAADNRFDPPTLNVQPGTTVRWTNSGTHAHTVTDRDGKFDSGDIAPGGTYSVTFQTPGTYRYYCKHHKGMEGTIVVGTAKSTGPTPATGAGTSGSKY